MGMSQLCGHCDQPMDVGIDTCQYCGQIRPLLAAIHPPVTKRQGSFTFGHLSAIVLILAIPIAFFVVLVDKYARFRLPRVGVLLSLPALLLSVGIMASWLPTSGTYAQLLTYLSINGFGGYYLYQVLLGLVAWGLIEATYRVALVSRRGWRFGLPTTIASLCLVLVVGLGPGVGWLYSRAIALAENAVKYEALGRAAVTAFHGDFNTGDYERIYDASAPGPTSGRRWRRWGARRTGGGASPGVVRRRPGSRRPAASLTGVTELHDATRLACHTEADLAADHPDAGVGGRGRVYLGIDPPARPTTYGARGSTGPGPERQAGTGCRTSRRPI